MGHDHRHDQRKDRLLQVMALNFGIFLVQIVSGIIAGSLALVSDALHNLSDFSSQLIAWMAIRIGERDSDLDRTFGYRRAEVIAALVNVGILFAVAGLLVYEGISRLFDPRPVSGWIVLIVAGIGFLANTGSALLLHREAKEDLNLRAAFVHLASDAVTSLGVIGAGIVLIVWDWPAIDALVTFPIVAFIVYNGWGILKEGIHILMEGTPAELDLLAVKGAIEALPEVAEVHHVHAWTLAPGKSVFAAHVRLAEDMPVSDADALLCRIKELLAGHRIDHLIIQFEVGTCSDDLLCRL